MCIAKSFKNDLHVWGVVILAVKVHIQQSLGIFLKMTPPPSLCLRGFKGFFDVAILSVLGFHDFTVFEIFISPAQCSSMLTLADEIFIVRLVGDVFSMEFCLIECGDSRCGKFTCRRFEIWKLRTRTRS